MENQLIASSTEVYAEEQPAAAPTSLLESILKSLPSAQASRSSTIASTSEAGSEAGASPASPPLNWGQLLTKWSQSLLTRNVKLAKVRFQLSREIGRIDDLLEAQVNAILHHPDFQALEAQWRGLDIVCRRAAALTREVEAEDHVAGVKIKLLNVSKRELARDFDRAVEFDQNSLFKKVYEEEFGMAGGTPYGLLLANYEFTNHPNDIDLLEQLAGVGAAAFCPVIAAASPAMVGVEDFTKLENPLDLDKIFQHNRFQKWHALRKHPDSQFLGVVLPRVLMREPYEDDGSRSHGFRFREDVGGSDQQKYLWGPATWAFGCVALRAFLHDGWFADIRGVQRGVDGGGVVSEFPVHSFGTDTSVAAQKTSVEVAISDRLETQLSQSGFIPLNSCKDSPYSVFYSNQSVCSPEKYDDPVATMNARVSSMLQYVLCSSRVAHFLRIEARSKIGSMASARLIEDYLNRWVMQYVTPDVNAPPKVKARFPLQRAEVQVEELPGKPGEYRVIMRLLPHYQLDSLSSSMTLTARRITGGRES